MSPISPLRPTRTARRGALLERVLDLLSKALHAQRVAAMDRLADVAQKFGIDLGVEKTPFPVPGTPFSSRRARAVVFVTQLSSPSPSSLVPRPFFSTVTTVASSRLLF